ncbi:MAG: ribosome-associated translation inhibitor RaiA [Clostridia bacterium]|nr:ribosome-associated translation inhibitor RaiA [Clostridia bacterium]MBQ4637936.1 ribosome-associated translation inhibitor RaiA [Clostridia bacterium]
MRIIVTGKNIGVSQALEDRVNKKVGKLSRYIPDSDNVDANVRLTLDKKRNICEVTIPIKGAMLRAQEESDNNMFIAIDKVCEKLERQIFRNRKHFDKRLKDTAFDPTLPEFSEVAYEEEEAADYVIVKEKRFDVEPMTAEEAIERMELLGHTFFLFSNLETDSICAVYKRNDGTYGLLVPQI